MKMHDPLTRRQLEEQDEVVRCRGCGTSHLESSWSSAGSRCVLCDGEEADDGAPKRVIIDGEPEYEEPHVQARKTLVIEEKPADAPEPTRRSVVIQAEDMQTSLVISAPKSAPMVVTTRTADRSRIEGAGWPAEVLDRARVLVVGAGAIGNEVLKTLALLGVRNILIVDLDEIEASNLTRSVLFRPEHVGLPKADVARRGVLELEPTLRVHALQGRVQNLLGVGAWRRFDLVFCCVDNVAARIHVSRMCAAMRTPMVEGGVDGLSGSATITFPPETPCYDCGLLEGARANALRRHPCQGVRLGEENRPSIPFTPTITSIIAGVMVQWGMQHLTGQIDGTQGLAFSFMSGDMSSMIGPLSMNKRCPTHALYRIGEGRYLCPVDEPIVARDDWSLDMTVEQLLKDARSAPALSPAQEIELQLDHEVTTRLFCRRCGFEKPLVARRDDMLLGETVCPKQCSGSLQPMEIDSTSHVGPGSVLGARTLRELGLRPLDWVGVNDPSTGTMVTFEITGDAREVFGSIL